MKPHYEGSVEEYLAETLVDSIRAQIESAELFFTPTVKAVEEKYRIKFDC